MPASKTKTIPLLKTAPANHIAPHPSRVWLEIDLAAICANYNRICKRVAPAQVLAVLKADAYGLGALPIAKALAKAGVNRFGVAELKEALALRKAVKQPVHILGGVLPWEVSEAVTEGIVLPISTLEAAHWISEAAVKQKRKARVHIKVDTGMGRLGLPYFEAVSQIRVIAKLPGLQIEGLYSHFANANNPAHPHAQVQVQRFKAVLSALKAEGIRFKWIHMANSDAINNLPKQSFNLVRTGINLYGVFDLQGRKAYRLTPTLELKTTLLARRRLPAGYTIGYGCTHALFEDTWVGTIPIGYADGIPLAASNSGKVLIHGTLCPIIGRVSMDYITVNLNGCKKAKVGDRVIVVGRSGKKEITIEDWAQIKQTHPYDIICSLGQRVERIYKSVALPKASRKRI